MDIVVEREWHVASHASALSQMSILGRIYGGFPRFRYLKKGLPPENLLLRPLPTLWNEAIRRLSLPDFLQADIPRDLAFWVARQANISPYLSCYSTVYRHLFPLLLERPTIRVLERGSTHPENYFHQIEKGKQEAGLPWSDDLPKGDIEEIEAGKLSHFVVAGSQLIAETYETRGCDPSRILTIPYGADSNFFKCVSRPNSTTRPLRIACVGVIGIRKGLGRLLKISEWAGKRNMDIQLVLVGPLEKEAPALLSSSSANIQVCGVKKGSDLLDILHSCDVYCLPSYEEGFGISVIEAMSTGLPAVVSNETGAREMISPGLDGEILSTFDKQEFDALLLPLFSDSKRRKEMGVHARKKVESGYTLQHYSLRVRSEYERMFSIVDDHKEPLPSAWSKGPQPSRL